MKRKQQRVFLGESTIIGGSNKSIWLETMNYLFVYLIVVLKDFLKVIVD